jgi:hypothetical protein
MATSKGRPGEGCAPDEAPDPVCFRAAGAAPAAPAAPAVTAAPTNARRLTFEFTRCLPFFTGLSFAFGIAKA